MVESNISFNLCDEDNDLCRRMFPDSNIAKNYCQDPGKAKYIIQFGISPYIKELVQSDLQGQRFTLHFDEITNDGKNGMMAMPVTLAWNTKKYLLHIVDSCTLENALLMMLVHFHEFMKKAALNLNFKLALGMDGPNINLLFKNKLKKEFSIIEVGTCPLNIVNNAFGKAVKALKENIVDFDEMAIDFHFFKSVQLLGENSTLLAMR